MYPSDRSRKINRSSNPDAPKLSVIRGGNADMVALTLQTACAIANVAMLNRQAALYHRHGDIVEAGAIQLSAFRLAAEQRRRTDRFKALRNGGDVA